MALTPKQRAHLKSLAHHAKAIHHVGKEGVTDAGIAAILEILNQRELIKVKVRDGAPLSAAETGVALAGRIPDLEHVQTIGRTVVLFRPHPEHPEISLDR